MLCERKKPYLSIGGTFSSFSTSDINDDNRSDGVTFYQEFLKEGLFQSAEITQTHIRQEENGKPIKPFAVYAIDVTTQDIEYTIERRYSCFHQLYKKLSKRVAFKTEFPTKTYLTPSTNEAVVSRRKTQLNSTVCCHSEFISELMSSNDPDLLVDLLEFLDLRQVYAKERILLAYQKEADKRMDEQVVLELLVRLGNNQDNLVQTMNELEHELFDNKLRITNEVIRQLFVGLGKRKGLLEVSLSEETRELDCFRGLDLIMRLLNFQQNRQAEVYIRNLAGCPIKNLKVHPSLLSSSKIKLDYFRLLEIYLKRNCDINYELTLEFLFGQLPEERKEFENWQKLRDKSSLNVQPYENVRDHIEMNESEIEQTVQRLKTVMREDRQHWEEVAVFHKLGNYYLRIESTADGVTRFVFDSNRPEEELRSLFIESMKWYRWTTISRSDPYARTLTVQVQTISCRKFQFRSSVEQLDRSTLVVRKPPARRPSADILSFYELVQLDPAPNSFKWRVKVLRFFDSASSRQYFRWEQQSPTEPLADVLLQ